jgi:hypothetical protein
MKKIYTLVAAFAVVLSANAQNKQVSTSTPMSTVGFPAISAERTVTDTLAGPSWASATAAPTLIGATVGGYVVGNNGYGDQAKVQAFINTIGTVGVEGALIWFGAKESDAGSSAGSKVTIKEYSLNGPGTADAGAVTSAPNTVNRSADLLFSDLDTANTFALGTNIVMFATPRVETGDFAIGVDFTTLAAGDTVGIICSSDGDAGGSELTWEKWDTGAWYSMLAAWPLDIDFLIWALVDNNPTGIEEGFLNGARLSQNMPNPATNSTTINYELQNENQNVSIMLFDVTGKLVQTINEGTRPAGKYSVKLETSNLEAGIYYYALNAGKGRIAKKMTIVK